MKLYTPYCTQRVKVSSAAGPLVSIEMCHGCWMNILWKEKKISSQVFVCRRKTQSGTSVSSRTIQNINRRESYRTCLLFTTVSSIDKGLPNSVRSDFSRMRGIAVPLWSVPRRTYSLAEKKLNAITLIFTIVQEKRWSWLCYNPLCVVDFSVRVFAVKEYWNFNDVTQ